MKLINNGRIFTVCLKIRERIILEKMNALLGMANEKQESIRKLYIEFCIIADSTGIVLSQETAAAFAKVWQEFICNREISFSEFTKVYDQDLREILELHKYIKNHKELIHQIKECINLAPYLLDSECDLEPGGVRRKVRYAKVSNTAFSSRERGVLDPLGDPHKNIRGKK
jgi:hypothetical protein